MEGCFLRLYVHENQHCHGQPAWEWLLRRANKLGIRGGSAFRAMAGFGRHHRWHEDKLFQLVSTQTVEVEFIVTDTEAQQLLDEVEKEKLHVFIAHVPARFGIINPDRKDAPDGG
ncbi:MAG TPA: DUF190 domain-containing protein [Burkholderiaceae bacterium]|nr:DUF190 domain-containing protein [Burkholderiaceae bacterium]